MKGNTEFVRPSKPTRKVEAEGVAEYKNFYKNKGEDKGKENNDG